MTDQTLAGQFLVATPIITQPPFSRSVVFLLEHDQEGAIGVVINRPTDLLVEDHIQGLDEMLSEPPLVFLGGPVASDSAVAIGRGTEVDFLRPSMFAGVGIVDIERQTVGLESLRIFAGYAGWDPDQLEAEIEEGAWWVLSPAIDEVFTRDVAGMWERSVERAPGMIPLYSTYPADPSVN
ncbi:MAG: YqgE/AlgH family protein [Acidimicrobiia bacterium]|nr:MAG: YqgE/AlgH family protein [Acidimicrobiia bacterium]